MFATLLNILFSSFLSEEERAKLNTNSSNIIEAGILENVGLSEIFRNFSKSTKFMLELVFSKMLEGNTVGEIIKINMRILL